MQLPGKVTDLDLKDVQAQARRRKGFWLRPLISLRTLYGAGLLIALAWGTVAGFLGQTEPNWQALGIIWAAIAAIFSWSFYSAKRGRAKGLAQLNAGLANRVNLESSGVKMDGPNEATHFFPWSNFKGWREGKRTILLDRVQATQFVILPVAQLSEVERQQLRGLLQSQIPVVR